MFSMRKWFKKSLFIRPMLKKVIYFTLGRLILEQLGKTSYPQGKILKKTFDRLRTDLPPFEKDCLTGIEQERKRLLSQTKLLVDGSSGSGGLYDKKVTIKQACEVSKQFKDALMLYLLTRVAEPRNVIELGTNVGISSSFIGMALKMNNQKGRLITLESSPYRLNLAKEVHRNVGLYNITYVEGLFADTLSSALRRLGSVDLAFVDGHHQYRPTLDYFEKILEYAAPDAMFVFDDIRWSSGMKKAWSKLRDDKRLGLIVDLYSIGICVKSQKRSSRRFIFPPLILPK